MCEPDNVSPKVTRTSSWSFGTPATAFLLTMATMMVFWSGNIRSDATPYGDGSRIMKWISFVRNAGGNFPLWDPYRNGGSPVMASPEHFWFQAAVIDPAGPHANLILNLLLVAYLLLAVPITWAICRRLNLAPHWAAITTILICVSEQWIEIAESARFAPILVIVSFLVVVWVLLKERLQWTDYAILVFSTALGLSLGIQYAIIHGLFIFSAFLFGNSPDWAHPSKHVIQSTARALAIGIAATLLSAIWLVPLVLHQANSYAAIASLSYQPNVPANMFQLARFALPYAGNGHYFLSLLIVPALILLPWGVPTRLRSFTRTWALPLIFALVFVAMTLPLVGAAVKSLYGLIPVISSVRQFNIAATIMLFYLSLAAALIWQEHADRRLGELTTNQRLALGVYSVLAGLTTGIYAIRLGEPITIVASGLLFVFGFYALISVRRELRRDGVERTSIGRVGAGLAVISVLAILSQAFAERHPVSGHPLHVDNKPELPMLQAVIDADQDAYFRVWKQGNAFTWIETANRGGAVFSLHFPRGFAYSLKYVSPDFVLSVQRPHWVKPLPCSAYDPRGLDLLAVRYLICNQNGFQAAGVPKGFEEVARDASRVLLKNKTNAPALKVFCRFKQVPPESPAQARDSVLAAFSKQELLIDKVPEGRAQDPECPPDSLAETQLVVTSDKPGAMTLRINAKQSGILMIPDNAYPGWRATVNGRETAILLAYHAYLGIPVERGESEIKLNYTDFGFVAGAWISTLALGLLALLCGSAIAGQIRSTKDRDYLCPRSGYPN